MKGLFLLLLIYVTSIDVYAESFQTLIKSLDSNDQITAAEEMASAYKEKARRSGSWGDPMVSVAAMNYPKNSLKRDKSMMTGIQFGLSQKMAISGKYGKLKEFGLAMSDSQMSRALQTKREFARDLWLLAIEKERLFEIEKVLKENLAFVRNNLKVTKRLYSTGKVPQQAVLDIQIRKSELVSEIEKNQFAREALKHRISLLMGSEMVLDVDLATVPWNYLEGWQNAKELYDYKEKGLKQALKAQDLNVSASNRNFIPDMTFSLSYTKRNDLDGLGDFVGAKISMPLPFSDTKYAAKSAAVHQKMKAEKSYRYYKRLKPNLLKKVEFDIKDAQKRLDILNKETLKYAKSSRDITAKSYSRGGADYLELLRAEMQYQKQLMNKVNLVSKTKERKLHYLFVKGDDLKAGGLK